MFRSVAVSFRCAFLRGIKYFLLRKNSSNFAEATRENRFTTMTPLGMSRDVTCRRLWHHNCFSNNIRFELIYFISIWTSQNLLKIHTFLCIRKRNKLFNHPTYMCVCLFRGCLQLVCSCKLCISFQIIRTMSWENLFLPHANNKGADQPTHPRSLISTFVVRCLDTLAKS